MKLLLTSPDALIDLRIGKFFIGIEEALDYFLSLNEENAVLTASIHEEKLKKIPEKFNPYHVQGKFRGSPDLIDKIVKIGFDKSTIVILGSKILDLAQAANSKLLFLTAKYSKSNNSADRIFLKDYGIPISNGQALSLFFERFSNVGNPWYYKLDIPPITTLYALTNANTYSASTEGITINNKFKECLKVGNIKYRTPFSNFFLTSVYEIYQEVNDIDFWSIYPTSTGNENPDLKHFLQKARESFKALEKPDMFIRHTVSTKRHYKQAGDRITEGCDEQFDTINLNPIYKGKLVGKSICILDDFTTYGTSCETVRILLEKEKVGRIIFIALGKFGNDYYKYEYDIRGDIYNNYIYKQTSRTLLHGQMNKLANKQFIESLKGLV